MLVFFTNLESVQGTFKCTFSMLMIKRRKTLECSVTDFCSGSKCVPKEIAFIFMCLVKMVLNILRIDMLGISMGRCLREIIEGKFLRHCWRVVGLGEYLLKIIEGDGNVGWIGWSGLEFNPSEENSEEKVLFPFSENVK